MALIANGFCAGSHKPGGGDLLLYSKVDRPRIAPHWCARDPNSLESVGFCVSNVSPPLRRIA